MLHQVGNENSDKCLPFGSREESTLLETLDQWYPVIYFVQDRRDILFKGRKTKGLKTTKCRLIRPPQSCSHRTNEHTNVASSTKTPPPSGCGVGVTFDVAATGSGVGTLASRVELESLKV